MPIHFPNRAERDAIWDALPVISTFSNMQNIVKKISNDCIKPSPAAEESYPVAKLSSENKYAYLATKSFMRCIALALPVLGNLSVPIYDFFRKREVLKKVRENGLELQNLSPRLQNDPDVVLAAVRQNASAFQYASENLRNDPGFVRAAVQQNPSVFQYASESLRNSPQLAMMALDKEHAMVRHVGANLMQEADFQQFVEIIERRHALKQVEENNVKLENLDVIFRGDEEIVRAAMKHDSSAFQHASKNLRNTIELAVMAVNSNHEMIHYVGDDLKKTDWFQAASIEKNWDGFFEEPDLDAAYPPPNATKIARNKAPVDVTPKSFSEEDLFPSDLPEGGSKNYL